MALENTLIAAGEAYDVYRNYSLHRQQQLLCVSLQQKNALHQSNIALVEQCNVSHLEIATLRQRNEESQRKIAELQKQIKELEGAKAESKERHTKRREQLKTPTKPNKTDHLIASQWYNFRKSDCSSDEILYHKVPYRKL